MLDLDKMSAPTSLTMSAKDQAANGGQFMSSAEFVAKQKSIKDFELIETKFNQLAKKILDELKQAQYSREFFQAIDEIIKEPLRTTIKIARKSPEQKRQQQQQQLAHKQAIYHHHQKQLNHSMGSGSNATTKHHQTIQQQARGNQQQQPRSLPVEMVPSQTVAQSSGPQKHRSAIPTSSIQSGFANSFSPRKSFSGESQIQRQQQQHKQQQQQHQQYPISRSATVGSALERRQQSSRKSPTGPSSIEEEFQNNLYRRQKNYSTSSVLTNNFSRSIDDYNNENDDNDENDLEDDDDDDDEDDDLDDDIEFSPVESPQKQQHQQLMKQQHQQQRFNQRFNPITKSKTLSDTTNISETSRQTKLQHQQQQGNHRQQLAQQHVQTQNQKHRFSPGQPTSSSLSCSYQTSEVAEPKSTMSLNSRDIGSLYKPHMNYSTSMLGNHRLSDDDEIIIIPTQSPSLISTSPDNNEANGDDPTERFSISRTKSFWEKLSKGNHNKRSSKIGSPNDNNPSTSIQATTTTNIGGGKHSATDGHHKHQHGKAKVLGLKLNGHSHTLDCMDSTGGSNSNYSCSSSSGDENGVSQSSHQNPTISKLQEMSRQNRFRQTR